MVDWLYAGLIRASGELSTSDPDARLGGKLLYAGELDRAGCPLLVASNIAGAASLSATVDVARQKQAIRDGVIDFLVTSLDEALRILKNEIRKRNTVAVCVALGPEQVEREMLELGVLPDLLPPGALYAHRFEAFIERGARLVDPVAVQGNQAVLRWSVDLEPALWLPKLDALAGDSLPPEAWSARRWLRLAPRYLGRQAQGMRLLRCDAKAAASFLLRVRQQVAWGEIRVPVEIWSNRQGESRPHRFLPPADSDDGTHPGIRRMHRSHAGYLSNAARVTEVRGITLRP
jgi:urocanate hydratase